MESSNLNSDEPEDVIENLLRRHASEALPDDGFTAAVLGKLPPARSSVGHRRPLSLRTLLIGLACLSSVVLMLVKNSGDREIASAFNLVDWINAAELLLANQNVVLAMAILTFSFATLYFLDTAQGSEE